MWSYAVELPQNLLRKHRLHLTEQTLTWDDRTIPLDQVTEVRAQSIGTTAYGIPSQQTYGVLLATPQERLKLGWGYSTLQKVETKQACQHAFLQLMDLLDHTVGARIAQHAAANLHQFGDYSFSPAGLTCRTLTGTKTIPWPAVLGATMADGIARVTYVAENGATKQLGGMSLWTPNAYFLHAVITAVKARYLGAQPGGQPSAVPVSQPTGPQPGAAQPPSA